MLRNCKLLALVAPFALVPGMALATESIEFVAEHLPEITMDNRYASLPLWTTCDGPGGDSKVCFGVDAGYARTHSGTLAIDGPLAGFNVGWTFRDYQLTGFAFFDDFSLSSGTERRPLEVSFASAPLALPAEAEFTGLDGTARDMGIGLALNGQAHWHWLPWFEWSAGLLWQQVHLSDYRFNYRLLDGPDAGTTGTLDYSATYSHVTPFLGAAWPRGRGSWRYEPHFQVAMPLPRRGFEGRITGPGFDVAGSTADHGNKPFGDPSLTLGFNVTYEPWAMTVDLGSTITQALLESKIHEGVEHNLMLTAYWTFQ